MTTLVFQNKGLIDLRCIETMGVNVKDNDNAIGFFGTGLKYALAVFLRTGHKVSLFHGTDLIEFGLQDEVIRGKTFQVITMNGQRLGFTTELGKKWELWMAFRELYCNARDEGGETYETDEVIPLAYTTTFVVQGGRELAAVWQQRDQVVLSSTPIHVVDKQLEIHPGRTKWLYYKGIRAAQLDQEAAYTYNFLGQHRLTEDRTLADGASGMGWHLAGLIAARTTDPEVIRSVMTQPRGTFEKSLPWEYQTMGNSFSSVVASEKKNPNVIESAARAVARALGHTPDYREVKMDSVQKADLKKAIKLVERLGYSNVSTNFPIIMSDELPDGTIGLAQFDKKRITISVQAFRMGVGTLAGTLLEEYLHLAYGLPDCSRNMQNHLFDALIAASQRISPRRKAV